MAKFSTSPITFLILRYMRRPILMLIGVYAISMIGWVLIPGIDAAGNPDELSFFHAFYFLTFTVTTTGFGELPHPFTEGQRIWGIISLYAGVVAWFYALGSIVGLVRNADFQQSLAERSFTKRVARIKDPFYIVCGYGNTGALLTRGLSDAGFTVIVIERKSARINTLYLRDYRTEVLGLCADARIPEHMIEAGLLKPNCRAVVALTQDEDVNLKLSVTARLLNPAVWVATQSTSKDHEDTLATLGEDVHIVDPFQTYAKYLGATIANPTVHTLNQWLAGTPGATLTSTVRPPKGKWILCGFGRMGHWIRDSLELQGMETVVIEPNPSRQDQDMPNLIPDHATQETLLKAGVKEAAGIVAGTNNDSDNLGILLNARALNPGIFFLVRQNRYRNQVVFKAAEADFIMMPSLVGARRILFLLIAPLLKPFFETLRQRDSERGGRYIDEVAAHLQEVVGGTQPRVWSVDTCEAASSALCARARAGETVTLGHLVSDPVDRRQRLACVPLVLRSGQATHVLPALSTPVHPGDQILFCGTPRAVGLLDAILNNEYLLGYLMTGVEEPRGYVMSWLTRRFPALKNAT